MRVIPIPRDEVELMLIRLREVDRLLGAAEAADSGRLASMLRRDARKLLALVIDGPPATVGQESAR